MLNRRKIQESLELIRRRNEQIGFKSLLPATESEITKLESNMGFKLPEDFKEFYTIANGFECTDDIFNFTSLEDIADDKASYGNDWFFFCEYMICSDFWGVRVLNESTYEIFNNLSQIVLTNSLNEFLKHFSIGNVFESEGLYDWQEKISDNNGISYER